jgi:DNA-binding transcriptional LysR family regulator
MRQNIPDIAVSASTGGADTLTQRLMEGTLDLAVMYRPAQPPGLMMEHLFDEELILVLSGQRSSAEFVFVDWGLEFQNDYAAAYPELETPALHLDIGAAGLGYLFAQDGQAYMPLRLVKQHLARGRLRSPKRARRFVYPVYMVYPETRDEEAYEPILAGLRKEAARFH